MIKPSELKRFLAVIAVMALLLGPGFTSPAIAAPSANITITVDTTTDSNNASYQVCSTAANDCSLRGAISKANADASSTYTIVLPANTYTLTQAGSGEDNNATGDLDILTSLTISGANSNTTIIDANKIDRVLDIIGAANSVWIQNVKITNGRAPDGAAGYPGTQGSIGGGIQNIGILTLKYCIVENNRAGDGGAGLSGFMETIGGNGGSGGDGGGIYTTNSLALLETIVRNNRSGDGGAGGTGGSIFFGGGGLSGGNGGNGGSGAGINNSGNLSMTRSSVDLNTTGNGGSGGAGGIPGMGMHTNPYGGPGGTGGNGGVGGGIFNLLTLTMNDSVVDDNLTGNGGTGGAGGTCPAEDPGPPGAGGAGGDGGLGGGIYNSGATATLDNSTISNNTTGSGGAGGAAGDGIEVPPKPAKQPAGSGGNGGKGGGTYNSGTLNLSNLTISGNTTGSGGVGGAGGDDFAPELGGTGGNGGNGGEGGGVYNTGAGTTNSNNATIADNSTSGGGAGGAGGLPAGLDGTAGVRGFGGGVLISAGTVTVMNTILANNAAPIGPDCKGNFTSQDYNLVKDVTDCTIAGSVGGNITGQDPKLGPLASNGGFTQTHALRPGSPAIDTANPAAPGSGGFACMAKDQRGVSRPIDGDRDDTATCDIGAYEKQVFLLYLPVLKK